jgi:hypothetical protein
MQTQAKTGRAGVIALHRAPKQQDACTTCPKAAAAIPRHCDLHPFERTCRCGGGGGCRGCSSRRTPAGPSPSPSPRTARGWAGRLLPSPSVPRLHCRQGATSTPNTTASGRCGGRGRGRGGWCSSSGGGGCGYNVPPHGPLWVQGVHHGLNQLQGLDGHQAASIGDGQGRGSGGEARGGKCSVAGAWSVGCAWEGGWLQVGA